MRFDWVAVTIFLLQTAQSDPVDPHATAETKNLFKNMMLLARNSSKVMFGHQEDTLNGLQGGHAPYMLQVIKKYGPPQNLTHDGNVQAFVFSTQQVEAGDPDELSDTKGVTGQYPAVSGFDFGDFVPDDIEILTYLARLAYARGQIVTISQHLKNPVTGGAPWIRQDKGNVLHTVKRILPGGDHNHNYKQNLDNIADFALAFKDSHGKPIPFVLRLLHEMNGDWFWWGISKETQNTAEDIKALFRYAVTYLRDHRGVHNVLYCMSPDKFSSKADYLNVHPGDDYIDVMGTDFYYDNDHQPPVSNLKRTLDDLVEMAESRHKIPALTEIGIRFNGLNQVHNFWNAYVLNILKSDTQAARIAFVLAWINHCWGTGNSNCQIWIPYKGHPAEVEFKKFYNDHLTVFANDIGNMYK